MRRIISKILRIFNLEVVRNFPRHSIRFAKEHFKDRPIIAVEIGTWSGENALSILKELNVKRIYLIDPYEEYEEYKSSELGKSGQKAISKAYITANKRLRKYSNKILFIKKYSEEALEYIPQTDFIYIDGNHEYEYVKKDIKNYYKKLKKGGILAGHDIVGNKFSKGILKALIEFSNKNKLTPEVSRTDWWIVKNK